jgi:ribosomal protein S18 acetylase RimI-like enzyme
MHDNSVPIIFWRKMLKIRRYQPQDNRVVKELNYAGLVQMNPGVTVPDNPVFNKDLDDIEGVYLNNRGDFIVGIVDSEIVAMGAIREFSANCGEIKRIRTRRDYQRKGYAETIMLKLIELARQLGYTELCLDTVVSNIPAQRLFEKLDFLENHRGKIGPYDVIYYGRKLG